MSNTDATLDFLRSNILDNLRQANGAGLDTLRAFRAIGRDLTEAKEAIGPTPKGAFGKWCEENFPFSKQWRARLMALHADWRGVELAMAWAEGTMKRVLGRKEYSVDGALALLAEWIKSAPEEAEAAGYGAKVEEAEQKAEVARQRKAEKDAEEAAGAEERQKAETEAESLRRLLAKALDRIKALEAENARLRGEAPKADKAEEAQAQAAKVDKATKARAKKVAAMVERPGQPGEALAAWDRLAAMGEKLGLTLADFLAACGLDYDSLAEAVAKAQAEADAAKVAA
jgi:hypothetical protein